MTAAPGREIEGGFSRRVLGWIIGIAAASFLAALLLSAFGEELGSWSTPDANTFSYSAIGHRAVVELLASLGLGVVSRQSRGAGASGAGPRTPLVLAEPDVAGGPPAVLDRIGDLRDEARGAEAVLVLVLPKWRGEAQDGVPGWIGRVSLRPEDEIDKVLGALDPSLAGLPIHRSGGREASLACTGRWPGAPASFAVSVSFPQLLAAMPSLEPVVTCGGDLLVGRRAPVGNGLELLVIADPDVLNNQGLARGDNAALVGQLFVHRLGARGAVFDETIHGFLRSRGLLAEAFRFPLLPAVLQTFLLVGVVLWAGMGRFGKPLPAPGGLAAGKDVLIDNTATLLSHGGHAAGSVARYHRQTVQSVAAAFFLPPGLPEHEVQRRLEGVSRSRGSHIDLAVLERQVDRLGDEPGAAPRALRLAGRLYRWRQEMMHGQSSHS